MTIPALLTAYEVVFIALVSMVLLSSTVLRAPDGRWLAHAHFHGRRAGTLMVLVCVPFPLLSGLVMASTSGTPGWVVPAISLAALTAMSWLAFQPWRLPRRVGLVLRVVLCITAGVVAPFVVYANLG